MELLGRTWGKYNLQSSAVLINGPEEWTTTARTYLVGTQWFRPFLSCIMEREDLRMVLWSNRLFVSMDQCERKVSFLFRRDAFPPADKNIFFLLNAQCFSDIDRDVVSIALFYFDRYLSFHTSIAESLYQLVAMTSLYLAVKVHSTRKISVAGIVSCWLTRGDIWYPHPLYHYF